MVQVIDYDNRWKPVKTWGGIGIGFLVRSDQEKTRGIYRRGIHSKCIRKNKTYDIIKTSLTMDRIIKYGKGDVVWNGGSARDVCGRILRPMCWMGTVYFKGESWGLMSKMSLVADHFLQGSVRRVMQEWRRVNFEKISLFRFCKILYSSNNKNSQQKKFEFNTFRWCVVQLFAFSSFKICTEVARVYLAQDCPEEVGGGGHHVDISTIPVCVWCGCSLWGRSFTYHFNLLIQKEKTHIILSWFYTRAHITIYLRFLLP